MKIQRRKNRAAEVYTSSLNDIMFFLLLFFLIISTMGMRSIQIVKLPNASAAENVSVSKQIQIAVTNDLRYFIENEEVTFDQIESELSRLLNEKKAGEKEFSVTLQADKDLDLQHVVELISIGYKLQVKMVLFVKK
jgi:biopolymer transport protein ExbD